MCGTVDWLLKKTKKNTKGCLIWYGARTPDGYPRVKWEGNANVRAHRLLFYKIYGYYPPVVRHTCDTPRCMNAAHLLPGTNLDNVRDRNERKRTGGYVSEQDIKAVNTLRGQEYTYAEIGKILQMKPKRVEYIHTQKGG